MGRRAACFDTLLLALLTILLIAPLFRLKYLDNWSSIESTFISDARMLSEHLPHPGWQPLWYCGTRTDYIYPPALRYGTVLISRLSHAVPARAYHLYIAIFYVFGIVAVYWFVRTGCRSRAPAFLAAAATALLSPGFLLMENLRRDSGFFVPQRLHVLMTYGEGPHISALAILPAALAATLVALRSLRWPAAALASLLCALVVSINFYGATALAIFYPIVAWSVWVTSDDRIASWRPILLRTIAIPALAWGLCAFWLTPSYLQITFLDLKWVSAPSNLSGRIAFLAAMAAFAIVSFWLGKRRPDRLWTILVAGGAISMAVFVLGWHFFKWVVSGDGYRLAPELDLMLILAGVEVLRHLWSRSRLRLAVVIGVLIAFVPSIRYIRHAWSPFSASAPLTEVYQYRIAAWVHEHLPNARVLPAGSIRFWFDAWSDNTQLDGGSAQGMLNQNIPAAVWDVQHGDRADRAVLWLQAMGTEAVVVPGAASPEPYHDYQHPEKFAGVLPVIFDDGHGTLIYAVPHAHAGIAKVVDTSAMKAAAAAASATETGDSLQRYVSLLETSVDAATLRWSTPDRALLHAETAAGESLLVQESFDSAWHAYEGTTAIPVRIEPRMRFMLLDLTPGTHAIELRFETPLENRIGQFVSGISLLIVVFLALRRRISPHAGN